MNPSTTVTDRGPQVDLSTMDHEAVDRNVPVVDQPSPPFPFMKLPAELRIKVLDHFFEGRRIEIGCDGSHCMTVGSCTGKELYSGGFNYTSIAMAITRVSKIVRIEAIISLLQTVLFDFQLLDHHFNWAPSALLKSYIKRMKHFYGPPKMLHFLNFITLQGSFVDEAGEKWVDECVAEDVTCDMTFDRFDIEDAMDKKTSNEAKLFADIKNAVEGPAGDRLTLYVNVEDDEPEWEEFEESYHTSIQVWKREVTVRSPPLTEEGKVNLKNVLNLLGLELGAKDKGCVEPVKDDDPDQMDSSQ